jgi:hypothetical protein
MKARHKMFRSSDREIEVTEPRLGNSTHRSGQEPRVHRGWLAMEFGFVLPLLAVPPVSRRGGNRNCALLFGVLCPYRTRNVVHFLIGYLFRIVLHYNFSITEVLGFQRWKYRSSGTNHKVYRHGPSALRAEYHLPLFPGRIYFPLVHHCAGNRLSYPNAAEFLGDQTHLQVKSATVRLLTTNAQC